MSTNTQRSSPPTNKYEMPAARWRGDHGLHNDHTMSRFGVRQERPILRTATLRVGESRGAKNESSLLIELPPTRPAQFFSQNFSRPQTHHDTSSVGESLPSHGECSSLPRSPIGAVIRHR